MRTQRLVLSICAAMTLAGLARPAAAGFPAWGDDSWRWEVVDTAEGFAVNWKADGASYQLGYSRRGTVMVRLNACDTQVRGYPPTHFWWTISAGSTGTGGAFDPDAAATNAGVDAGANAAPILARMQQIDDSGTGIDPRDPNPPATDPPDNPCAKVVDLQPGRYTVTLGIATNANGPELSRTREIEVGRIKAAVIGDSMASGEGNPDVPAELLDCWPPTPLCTLEYFGDAVDAAFNGMPDAFWMDRRCHRSTRSGFTHALSGLDYADGQNAVTALSFACSGAGTNALLKGYKGEEPRIRYDYPHYPQIGLPPVAVMLDKPATLPAQIDALAAALPPRPRDDTIKLAICPLGACLDLTPDERPRLDALVISMGIDDLDFVSLLKGCASPTGDCTPLVTDQDAERIDEKFEAKFTEIEANFGKIADRIEKKLDVGRVYITEYPVFALTDSEGNAGGCGVFSLIGKWAAQGLHHIGVRLNEHIAKAAIDHGWHYVGGIANDFKRHGYCAGDESWFVQLRESLQGQINTKGTIHPNEKGHAAIGAHLVKAFEDSGLMVRRGLWRASYGGKQPWSDLNFAMDTGNLLIGDFDGDRRQDVLHADGRGWQLSRGGTERWQQWNALDGWAFNLRVGDFNGDGVDDLFKAEGGKWYVSYSASGPWVEVNTSTVPLIRLRFGKFGPPGDTTTDVFYANSSGWYVSDGATGRWRLLFNSPVGVDAMAFADVNGDGRTDVLTTVGSTLRAKYTGSANWVTLGSLPVPLSQVSFGNFDGNKKADAFWVIDGTWYVSYDSTQTPTKLHGYKMPVGSYLLGDFDGDGKSDVFTSERPVN